MNITQFLARLSRGPLSNLSMSNEGDGTIVAGKIPAIVDYLNDGLLDIYGRFNLKESELVLELDETINYYRLHSAYAQSTALDNPLNPHYITDSADRPFTDDLIQVLRVYTSSVNDLPEEVALNDDNHPKSVFTPNHDTLQVPDPVAGVSLSVIYQAMHAPLVSTDLTATIYIPPVLETALINFVAHKVYFHMNGQEHSAKASEHFLLFENRCAEVQNKDLVNASLSNTNTKFAERGFI